MTPELIDLARRAMALEGAPVDALWRLGLVRHDDTGNVIVDLADTGADGWALGGVLLGALSPAALESTKHTDGSWSVLCRHPATGWTRRFFSTGTLAEACCRVAVALGRWPGTL